MRKGEIARAFLVPEAKVVYLTFNEGYSATAGKRAILCEKPLATDPHGARGS